MRYQKLERKMLKSTANYSHEEDVQVRHRVLKTLI